jgi:dolichyl-phosphate-mannose--protein O-mannosyl transferase
LIFGAFTFLVWQGNQQDAGEEEIEANRSGFFEHLIWVPLGMAVIPAAIYMLSYAPFFGAGFTFSQWRELQYQMWYYHSHLKATHQYQSTWWQWPLAQRPVWYGVQYFDNGIVGNTYANGSPLLYWSFFGAVPYALILWWQREKYRQMLVLSIGFFGQWLPWALSPRIAYAYHFLPAAIFGILAVAVTIDDLWFLGERQKQEERIPLWPYAALGFLAILLANGLAIGKDATFRIALSVVLGVIFVGLGFLLGQSGDRIKSPRLTSWQYVAILYTVLLVGAFVFFYPIYSNWPLAKIEVDARMWLTSWR